MFIYEMASVSTALRTPEVTFFYENLTPFPPIIDGRLNAVKFLEAASALVSLVDRLGKTFAPVKYDLQGNIDKIKKHYKYDDTSCLMELMLNEIRNGKHTATEGILWLNRALFFFELLFQEIITNLKLNNYNTSMSKMYISAYEGSIKKYHNWVTQQLFALICKMSPTLPQLMKSLHLSDDDVTVFESLLTNFNVSLHLVRCKIDDFFEDHNIFEEMK